MYDTIEESEYEKLVLARADDDWIVDGEWSGASFVEFVLNVATMFADGTGYVEDGREIFDEDCGDDEPKASGSKSSKGDAKAKKRLRDINAPASDSKSNIKRLFGNAANKRSDAAPKLMEDDILSDILGEMDSEAGSVRPSPILAMRRSSKDASEKKRVSEFMRGFVTNKTSQKLDKSDDVSAT